MTKNVAFLSALFLCTASLAADKKEITIKLTVPDAAWTIAIDEVHQVGNELWVVSTVSRDPNAMGAQVISTVRASAKLEAPELPLKHFVIGKTWGWKNEEPYTFVKNRDTIEKDVKAGDLLYRRKKKES